jgi:pimeloyl-ACP methyl ester carboxylesterase
MGTDIPGDRDSGGPPAGGSTAPSGTLAVFVHGSWHSGLHWAATQRALTHLGIASIAIDLPGHGLDAPVPTGYFLAGQPGLATERSALADLTMQECADSLLAALAAVRSQYRRVVLVAHSAGGGPASTAAEQAPELVDHLVYVSAFVPAGRPQFFDYINAPENAAAVPIPAVGNPFELGVLRINPLSPDPEMVGTIRQAFLSDLPSGASDSWRRYLHPDVPLALAVTPVEVTAQRWGRIPRTYVRLTEDRGFAIGAQDLVISETDQAMPGLPTQVRTLTGGHSPFVTQPGQLAGLILDVERSAALVP